MLLCFAKPPSSSCWAQPRAICEPGDSKEDDSSKGCVCREGQNRILGTGLCTDGGGKESQMHHPVEMEQI